MTALVFLSNISRAFVLDTRLSTDIDRADSLIRRKRGPLQTSHFDASPVLASLPHSCPMSDGLAAAETKLQELSARCAALENSGCSGKLCFVMLPHSHLVLLLPYLFA